LSVVFASLLISLAASDCQYALYDDPLLELSFPVAINHCHSSRGEDLEIGMTFTCESEDELTIGFYDTYDCSGKVNFTVTYTHDEMYFDCSSSKMECGKTFGLVTPCGCSVEDDNCDYAFSYSLVDQTCVRVATVDTGYYQKWDISCTDGKAITTIYTDDACVDDYNTKLTTAGCITSSAYTPFFGSNQVEWQICADATTTTQASTTSSAHAITNIKTLFLGLFLALAVVA